MFELYRDKTANLRVVSTTYSVRTKYNEQSLLCHQHPERHCSILLSVHIRCILGPIQQSEKIHISTNLEKQKEHTFCKKRNGFVYFIDTQAGSICKKHELSKLFISFALGLCGRNNCTVGRIRFSSSAETAYVSFDWVRMSDRIRFRTRNFGGQELNNTPVYLN